MLFRSPTSIADELFAGTGWIYDEVLAVLMEYTKSNWEEIKVTRSWSDRMWGQQDLPWATIAQRIDAKVRSQPEEIGKQLPALVQAGH